MAEGPLMAGDAGRLDVSGRYSALWPALTRRLLNQYRSPVCSDGCLLIASAGIMSRLGLIYWLLAAQLYSVTEIGLNSALMSTMLAVGGIVQLNLGSVLIRLLPSLGRRNALRLIASEYC